MVKRYIILLSVLIAGFGSLSNAQDPHFSQFYANPLYLNPALAGSENCPRISLNYRNQWPGLGNTYVTYSLSYDQHLSPIHGGIGLNILRDVQADGALTTTSINAMYSYTLKVTNKFYMAAGFQASFFMSAINWDFIFPDMIHPLYGPIYSSYEHDNLSNDRRNYPDFSIGLIGFTEKTFLGFAVHHLTQPSISFLKGSNDSELLRKYTVHFGTEFEINPRGSSLRRGDLKLSPQILFYQQGRFQQFNWGLYLSRKQLVVGLWARQNFSFHYDAVMMIIGFKQDNLRFAYSYDLTVSELSRSVLGAHEISAAFVFGCRVKPKKIKSVNCPSF
ncbi:MAG: type IX secretion system membrane protein PorP/SprF [Bacteroidales bacterium]|jgi:type IX secretion system PorP/SprF family membrane protein|nr:type IX secretion system membrane protein PorP/SprF [Bacteroidales bacterium]